MEMLIFMFIYILSFLIMLVLIKKSGVNIFRFSIPSIVFFSIFIFAYIGFPFLMLQKVPLYVDQGVTNNTTLWKAFLLSSFVWIQFFIGYFVGGKYFEINDKKIKIDHNITENTKTVYIFFSLLFISIIVLILYLNMLNRIALFEAIKGVDSLKVAFYRSEMTNNFYKYHRFALFFNTIIPFLSYISFSTFLITKTEKWRNIFIFMFFFTAFVLTMDTQKAPVIWYLIALFFIFILVSDTKLTSKSILKFGSVLFFILGFMYVVFMGNNLSIKTLSNPIRRAIVGQLAPLYWYVEIYPDEIGFVNGRTFPNPAGIFPWEPYRYTVEVNKYIKEFNKDERMNETVGSSPTAFFGELWVNFGLWPNFIFPSLLGFMLIGIHNTFLKRVNGPISIALMVWLAFHFKDLATTGISKYLFDLDLYIILLITFLFCKTSEKRKR